ncbi:MAG: heme-binding protein [Gemmatimonadetes bacterium]|nr:heme-binding protein [Gemmatimonadota bacterium]
MRRSSVILGAFLLAISGAGAAAQEAGAVAGCDGLPTAGQLRDLLQAAAVPANPALSAGLRQGPGGVGGLFNGTRMWAAAVNRDARLCAFATSTGDPSQVWPGSQQIAKAKAYTANAFSLDFAEGGFPLSTAQLYTFVQPGHSLYGLNQSNPFEPEFLAPPGGPGGGRGDVAGGIITFGGGVALYQNRRIVGGLGVSGDTACTDHEIAKRVRDLAHLNPNGRPLVDDITYSTADGASAFTHPLCPNTYRNGVFVGNELPATGY